MSYQPVVYNINCSLKYVKRLGPRYNWARKVRNWLLHVNVSFRNIQAYPKFKWGGMHVSKAKLFNVAQFESSLEALDDERTLAS